MPSLAEGAYPLSTPGFHAGADWACSLDLKVRLNFLRNTAGHCPLHAAGCRQRLHGRFLSSSLHP
jgi:hypothetical protein